MSADQRHPPPEALLIRRAREATGLSPERAARLCAIKIGGRRWRQLEAGEENKGGPRAVAGDMQLAHMAHTVGVSSPELAAVGRQEAAEILLRITPQSRVAEVIEAGRLRQGLGLQEAAIKSKNMPDRWTALLAVREPEDKDVTALARMARTVGMTSDDLFRLGDPVCEAVGDELLRLEADVAGDEMRENLRASQDMLFEAQRRLGLLPYKQFIVVKNMIDELYEANSRSA